MKGDWAAFEKVSDCIIAMRHCFHFGGKTDSQKIITTRAFAKPRLSHLKKLKVRRGEPGDSSWPEA
jgi:hypothetical protein